MILEHLGRRRTEALYPTCVARGACAMVIWPASDLRYRLNESFSTGAAVHGCVSHVLLIPADSRLQVE